MQNMKVGETSRKTAIAIRQHRKIKGMSLREMSLALNEIGWPTLITQLSKVELNQRRVDVDDLVAFATVLGVSPIVLLGWSK